MLLFRDTWINPPNLVSIKAGTRNMEAVRGKGAAKTPTVEVVCVGKAPHYFDCTSSDEAEKLASEWVEEMKEYNAHWMR